MPIVVHVDEKNSAVTVQMIGGDNQVFPLSVFDFVPKAGDWVIIVGEGADVRIKSGAGKNMVRESDEPEVKASDEPEGRARFRQNFQREAVKYPRSVVVTACILMVIGLLINIYAANAVNGMISSYSKSLFGLFMEVPPTLKFLLLYFSVSSAISLAAIPLCLSRFSNSERIGIPFFLVLFFAVSIPASILLLLASNWLYSDVRSKSSRLLVTSVDESRGAVMCGNRMLRAGAFLFKPKPGDIIDYYDNGSKIHVERVTPTSRDEDVESDYLRWSDLAAIWSKFFICGGVIGTLLLLLNWEKTRVVLILTHETPFFTTLDLLIGLVTAPMCWIRINASRKIPLWMQVLAFFYLGPWVGAILFVVNGRARRSSLYREIKNAFIRKIPLGLLHRKTFWVKLFLAVGIVFMYFGLYEQLELFWDKFDVSAVGFRGLSWMSESEPHVRVFIQTVILIICSVIGLCATVQCLFNVKNSRTNSLWVKIPVLLLVNTFAGMILLAFDHVLPKSAEASEKSVD